MMNVSHGVMPELDTTIIGLLFLTLNNIFPVFDLEITLIITLFFSIIDYSLYFIFASLDMKKALDLNIFSLKYPVGHNKCRNKNYGFNVNGTENEKAFKNIQKAKDLIVSNYMK
jgi:hypothetical protein